MTYELDFEKTPVLYLLKSQDLKNYKECLSVCRHVCKYDIPQLHGIKSLNAMLIHQN